MTHAGGSSEAAELLDLARRTANEVASLVLERHGEVHAVETKASDLDLVTAVDRAAEERIASLLLDARPDDSLLGEEGSGVVGTSGVEWVVDPIDGTTSFYYGLPGFSVSIGARRGGEWLAGCVVAPALRAEYAAARGRGATLNAVPVRCRETTALAKALIATGFSPDHERRARQAGQIADILPQIRDIRRMGSAALDLCAVAAGQVDAYYEVGLSVWDHAAGALIAAEAGAVTIVEPDPVTGRAFVVAAAPGIADELVALLRTHNADKV